jgi:hypothetical protein
MPEVVADPPSPSCFALFYGLESRNFNDLILISFLLAGTRAGAPPGVPTPGAACPISPPGRRTRAGAGALIDRKLRRAPPAMES